MPCRAKPGRAEPCHTPPRGKERYRTARNERKQLLKQFEQAIALNDDLRRNEHVDFANCRHRARAVVAKPRFEVAKPAIDATDLELSGASASTVAE